MKLLKGDELIEYINRIKTKHDFDYFLKSFVAECADPNSNWDNSTLLEFLSGMAIFSAEIEGYYHNHGHDTDVNIPTWRMFAEILCAARVCD